MASKLRKSMTLVRVVFIDTWAIPELDGRSLHNHCSDPESDCWRLLGSTPATQRYKGRLCGIKTQEIADPCERCLYRYPGDHRTRWADFSTTTAPILNPIAGDCWARRQLRNGIGYVPSASELIKSISSVQVSSWRYFTR